MQCIAHSRLAEVSVKKKYARRVENQIRVFSNRGHGYLYIAKAIFKGVALDALFQEREKSGCKGNYATKISPEALDALQCAAEAAALH